MCVCYVRVFEAAAEVRLHFVCPCRQLVFLAFLALLTWRSVGFGAAVWDDRYLIDSDKWTDSAACRSGEDRRGVVQLITLEMTILPWTRDQKYDGFGWVSEHVATIASGAISMLLNDY